MTIQASLPIVGAFKVERQHSNSAGAIPYKTVKTPFEQHGLNEIVVIIIFCLIALGIATFLRKRNIGKLPFIKDKKIKIIERTRISAHSSILLIQYNDQLFLMSRDRS